MNFDRLALLEQLLETTMDKIRVVGETAPEKTAPLIKEARFIGQEIAEITGTTATRTQQAQTPVDELRARREQRKKGRA